jgi:hypothetical protein
LGRPNFQPRGDGVGGKRKRPTGGFTRWNLAPVQAGELARWEALDGRWVAITVGHGASAGDTMVADSRGRYEAVDSYEDALVLAKSWRT